MFNFWHKFSSSPKQTRFERLLTSFFVLPELDSVTRDNVKKRILNRIAAEQEEFRNAEILDRKLSGQKVGSNSFIDLLAAIAEAILNLPKVAPSRAARVETRENFRTPVATRIYLNFRQATAFFVLLIFAGGITITTFISQIPTAAAQLSVSSGVVKIRVADSPFFEDVKKVATVRLGDTIRVEKGATAELAFYDASKMKLTESTEVAITDFKPDFVSRKNSSVKIALLSGSVDAEVAKPQSSFSIETPTGSVEATTAKFSVAVNSATGSTEIKTSEDVVAVKSTNNSESVALVAGESVIFDEQKTKVAVAEIPELPSLAKIQTELELVKIWSFDALVAAQSGDNSVAQKTLTNNHSKLASILTAAGAEVAEGEEAGAFQIFLQKNYPEGSGRELALASLQQSGEVEKILNYYFTAPRKLRGVPALEILARDGYTPPGQLRNLFAVLRAGEIAHPEIAPLVENLSNELIAELSAGLSEKNLDSLLTGMRDQPIFIPALQKLIALAAPELTEKITTEIAAMQERVSEYIGG
ncbi:MAG: FecR family protein [Patescibacteria group bacterium]